MHNGLALSVVLFLRIHSFPQIKTAQFNCNFILFNYANSFELLFDTASVPFTFQSVVHNWNANDLAI